MALSKAKFYQGMTPSQYMEQIKVNKQPFLDIYQAVAVPEEARAFFSGLAAPLRVAVFTADWCGDALSTTPAVLRLAAASDSLEARVFNRDQELDLTNSFLPEHRHSTVPVFVVLDAGMGEVARFIETARSLVPELEAMHHAVAQQTAPAEGDGGSQARGRRTAYRVAHARQWGRIILREFQATVAAGLALPAGQRPAEGGTQWPPPDQSEEG